MKKIILCLLMCSMFASFYVPVNAETTAWKEYYVSKNGDDGNPGTKDAPFKTIQAAKDAVRNVNRQMQGDIVVNIMAGTYYLDETLDFSNEDSAYNGHKIIYRGIGDNKPVISGGERVTNFRQSQYEGIWEADYDTDVLLQLTVDGKKRYPAKGAELVKGVMLHDKYLTDEYFAAHPEVDKNRKYDYNDLNTPYKYDGFLISKRDFGMYENPEDVLLMWDRCFITSVVPVEEIKPDPDSMDNLLVLPSPGLWNDFRTKASIADPNPSIEFTVMNAFELLDEPGEFYYNRKTKKLYYMPEEREDMNNSVVVAPVLETIVCIDGNDVDDKINNLVFENLQFCDTKMDYLEGFSTSQAVAVSGSGFTGIAPRAFFAMRIDGIEIKNNIFCNIGGAAIGLSNGVENAVVTGNAIYDVGENGIVVGERNHSDFNLGSPTGWADDGTYVPSSDGVSDPVPEESKDKPVNLMMDMNTKLYYSEYTMGGIVTSSPTAVNYPGYPGPDDADYKNYDKIHTTYLEDDYREYNGVWRDTYSKTSGKKPYVMIEFLRPYSIEEITVTFDPNETEQGENADYEVLVSKDKSFSEGTYKVIATQNGIAPSDVNQYSVGDGEKYRYVMIRKLTASDFALSRVWITTTDRKPWVKNQRCKNIDIENNIFERIGTEIGRSIGITVLSADNGTIKHNDVKDISYTGISVGYQWGNWKNTCYNMDVGYNYVYDVAQTGHDGGGIYVLGAQPNSRYYNNHIECVNLGINAFYTDNGSRYETIENNYMENCQYILSPYTTNSATGVWGNTFRNNFGLHTVANDASKSLNDYEEPKQEVIGQPSRAAYDTYANAGLEKEYQYLRDIVPRRHDNFYSKYDIFKKADASERSTWSETIFSTKQTELTYTLKNAKFGEGLGMYPTAYKSKLEAMSNYLSGGSNSDRAMRIVTASEFETQLKALMKRYSLSETIKLCEDLLVSAKGEEKINYPESAIKEFEKSIEAAKKLPTTTGEQQYDALTAFENAYNTMIDEKYSDMIISATMPDAVDTKIDAETNTVTIYVSKDASLVTDKLDIQTEGNSSVSRIIAGDINLADGINVPVYHKGTKKYRIWTVKAEYLANSDACEINKDSGWSMNTDENDMIKRGTDSITLPGSHYAYVSEISGGDKETTINFNPLTKHEIGQFSVILGANSPQSFDYGNSSSAYNRCEIEFKGKEAKFYKVVGGKRILIDTSESNIKWNEKNDFVYEIKEINENTHFIIKMNGRLIFSEVIQKCSYGGYIGFYTPYMNIRIY